MSAARRQTVAPDAETTGGGPTGGSAAAERVYDLFQTGRRFLAERHPGQAAMYLERALRLAPDKNSIREALGRSYYALGRYESAAEEFEELLRRAPRTTTPTSPWRAACSR